MKLLICSDIHGDITGAEAVIRFFNEEKCDKILILGDILYHGPRNDLPSGYAPKAVIKLLNEYKDSILAVRGNCDAEVDDMVLEFPIMADYALLNLDGVNVFATHGHHYNTATPPKLKAGDVLLHGHTHVLKAEEVGNENLYLNPGSVSLPKEGTPKGYILYEKGVFSFRRLDGEEYNRYSHV